MAEVAYRDVAYERIRKLIVTGELRPGERLVEEALGTRLGMSRSPVREALKLLVQDGFVTTSQFVGARVAELGRDDADEVFEIRILLEALAARRVAKYATPSDIRELETLVANSRKKVAAGKFEEVARLNLRFHTRIAELSRSAELQRTLDRLRLKIEWLFHDHVPYRGDIACAEHTELVAAISSGDADLAEALARAHILHSRRHYEEMQDLERRSQDQPAALRSADTA